MCSCSIVKLTCESHSLVSMHAGLATTHLLECGGFLKAKATLVPSSGILHSSSPHCPLADFLCLHASQQHLPAKSNRSLFPPTPPGPRVCPSKDRILPGLGIWCDLVLQLSQGSVCPGMLRMAVACLYQRVKAVAFHVGFCTSGAGLRWGINMGRWVHQNDHIAVLGTPLGRVGKSEVNRGSSLVHLFFFINFKVTYARESPNSFFLPWV